MSTASATPSPSTPCGRLVDGAARAIKTRVPRPGHPRPGCGCCDWWTGPRLFILVDDYDMVGGGSDSPPFDPLLDHLALGYESGCT